MSSFLEIRLTGGSANVDPSLSLGGTTSNNTISNTSLNNLFDNIDPSEANAGDNEYRFIDIINIGDTTATSVAMYISEDPTYASDFVTLELGHDETNNPHSTTLNLETLAVENTPPTSPVIEFDNYTYDNKLLLPDIPVGLACRVAFKRIIDPLSSNYSNDTRIITLLYA